MTEFPLDSSLYLEQYYVSQNQQKGALCLRFVQTGIVPSFPGEGITGCVTDDMWLATATSFAMMYPYVCRNAMAFYKITTLYTL
jgi:hypothetical protein